MKTRHLRVWRKVALNCDAFRARASSRVARFRENESGAITAFMLAMLLTMFVAAGMAIDFMRHETVRASLQNGLDRGVLAAANLDQTVDAESVVRTYLTVAAYVDETVDLEVTPPAPPPATPDPGTPTFGGSKFVPPTPGVNNPPQRRIDARASMTIDTLFLRFIGIPTLQVVANAAAEHARQNIEISLVLDVSGTMAWEDRIDHLIPAASGFVTQVLDPLSAPFTSINLVPYAGGVNPGPALFDMLGGERFHNRSSCIELTAADFDTPALPSAGYYSQVPHFHWWPIADNQVAYMDEGWCPSDAEMAIELMSNNAERLVDRIEGLRLHDGTGTHIGMKWALALLDPSSNATIASLAATGEVPAEFDNRPAAWNAGDTMKFIVLMTDGMISDQHRPGPPYLVEVDPDPTVGYDATVHNSPRAPNRDDFFALCNLAKANGVTVFTIAFEVPAENEWEMRDCASSPAHFFSVEGLQIANAFSQIAATIQNLKLVN
jgi:hypothetical protein